jgi:hypothetical protein
MSSRPQPVPPANRSDKGPGDAPKVAKDDAPGRRMPGHPAQQGQQGNTKQNTTNQGYQQDR